MLSSSKYTILAAAHILHTLLYKTLTHDCIVQHFQTHSHAHIAYIFIYTNLYVYRHMPSSVWRNRDPKHTRWNSTLCAPKYMAGTIFTNVYIYIESIYILLLHRRRRNQTVCFIPFRIRRSAAPSLFYYILL